MSNLIDHAKREFLKLGYKPVEECEDDPDKWIQESVLELLEVFSKQGHSGSSAPYAIHYFEKLAAFEPLAPVMCTDDEWMDVTDMCDGDITYQNNRCSAVFKHGKDGKPYYIDAIVFKSQNGSSFTSNCVKVRSGQFDKMTSRQTIKIPFKPKTFYIDVIEYEIAPDDWESYIKDEKQLNEVWKYYEKPESLNDKRLKKLENIDAIFTKI